MPQVGVEDTRPVWLATAALLLAVGGVAVTIAVANDARAWWTTAAVLGAVGLAVAAVGVAIPWWAARRLWRQDLKFPADRGWVARHRPIPAGVVFELVNWRGGAQLPIVLCELKRRGSRVLYTALKADRFLEARYQPVEAAFYPDDFVGPDEPAPPFDHVPFGCYKQVWWGWDAGQNRKVLVARERFPIFPPGQLRWRQRRCAED
jgi:hypothetical protein